MRYKCTRRLKAHLHDEGHVYYPICEHIRYIHTVTLDTYRGTFLEYHIRQNSDIQNKAAFHLVTQVDVSVVLLLILPRKTE